jgi:hypothetical protein
MLIWFFPGLDALEDTRASPHVTMLTFEPDLHRGARPITSSMSIDTVY